MTSGKSSQQYLLKVFLSELFLNLTFALIRLNGGSGPQAAGSQETSSFAMWRAT